MGVAEPPVQAAAVIRVLGIVALIIPPINIFLLAAAVEPLVQAEVVIRVLDIVALTDQVGHKGGSATGECGSD